MSSDFSQGLVWAGESASRSDPSVYRRPDGGDEQQIVAEVASIEADILNKRFKSLINDESTTIIPGTSVYMESSGKVKKTVITAIGTAYCLGLVSGSNGAGIIAAAAGNIQCNGEVTLTTAQWDAIAGTSGGLTPGVVYYAGAAGVLTSTLPATTGNFDTTVGIALSSTTLLLRQNTNTLAHA